MTPFASLQTVEISSQGAFPGNVRGSAPGSITNGPCSFQRSGNAGPHTASV